MRIAVVGSGISGLVSTYLLQRHHEVVLFEANDYVGGHTHTVRVDFPGESHLVDTGFIVFNDWTYPNFMGLLKELDVASQPTTMGFSVHCDRCGLEYAGTTLATLFAQWRNVFRPSHYYMLGDIIRFNRQALQESAEWDDQLTLGELLRKEGYSATFAEHYLLPMGAAIWSCPMTTFEQFPARFIAEFYRNHGLLNIIDRPTWHVVSGGSRTYVDRMVSQLHLPPRLKSRVQQITRHEDRVELHLTAGTESFDEVVLACHSDQALRMLQAPTSVERDVLAAFPYGDNTAVLHTDEAVLPQRRQVWSSWNYHIRREEVRPAVTYHMNILQGLTSRRNLLVTLNAEGMVNPETVLGTYHYSHPVFTAGRAEAQRRHGELIRTRRTSYCGAYWGNGFHEDGVVSALRVCAAFGVVPDWSDLPGTGVRQQGESHVC